MPEEGPDPAASPAPASPASASPASAGPAAAGRTPARAAIILVGLCFGLNALSRGMGETFATFLLALTEDFKTDRAAVAAIYSVQMLIAGFGRPLAGCCFARFGPLRPYHRRRSEERRWRERVGWFS